MAAPLADRVRPATLDQVVGQQHILGPGRALRKIIEAGEVPNMVFYGPAGVGKTTVASIIAKNTKRHLVKLNGTTASTADIKEAVASTNTFEGINGVLLYLDEIQYFNKKQQQTSLEFMENGSITLIASTTENHSAGGGRVRPHRQPLRRGRAQGHERRGALHLGLRQRRAPH